MIDYFEMERVIEELAKAYPAQCATTWFKITKNHKPSQEEYRKELVKKSLAREIEKVIKGDNKDVERRHKHYVVNSPSNDSKNTFKEISEQPYMERIIDNAFLIKEKKRQKNKDHITTKEEEEEQRRILYENNPVLNKRRRKKKL